MRVVLIELKEIKVNNSVEKDEHIMNCMSKVQKEQKRLNLFLKRIQRLQKKMDNIETTYRQFQKDVKEVD